MFLKKNYMLRMVGNFSDLKLKRFIICCLDTAAKICKGPCAAAVTDFGGKVTNSVFSFW